jgi:hypothetical protein
MNPPTSTRRNKRNIRSRQIPSWFQGLRWLFGGGSVVALDGFTFRSLFRLLENIVASVAAFARAPTKTDGLVDPPRPNAPPA